MSTAVDATRQPDAPRMPLSSTAPGGAAGDQPVVVEEMVVEEMLVEEISIDGMCGVY